MNFQNYFVTESQKYNYLQYHLETNSQKLSWWYIIAMEKMIPRKTPFKLKNNNYIYKSIFVIYLSNNYLSNLLRSAKKMNEPQHCKRCIVKIPKTFLQWNMKLKKHYLIAKMKGYPFSNAFNKLFLLSFLFFAAAAFKILSTHADNYGWKCKKKKTNQRTFLFDG